jgi:hypothetical protein
LVGIVAIVSIILVLVVPPLFTPSDEVFRQKSRARSEVKALYERYGQDYKIEEELIQHFGVTLQEGYRIVRGWNFPVNETITEPIALSKELILRVRYDVYQGTTVDLICIGEYVQAFHPRGLPTTITRASVDLVRTNDCLDNTGQIPADFIRSVATT